MYKLCVGLWMPVQTDCLLWVLSGPGGWDLPATSYDVFLMSFIEFPITMLVLLSWSRRCCRIDLAFFARECCCVFRPANLSGRQADSEADRLLLSGPAPARPCLTGIRLTLLILRRGEGA